MGPLGNSIARMVWDFRERYGLLDWPGELGVEVSKEDTDALEAESLSDTVNTEFVDRVRREGIRSLWYLLGEYPVTWDAPTTKVVVKDKLRRQA